MINYIVPFIAFLLVVSLSYYFSKDADKDQTETIMLKNVAPGAGAALLTYLIMIYRDDIFTPTEELMTGNYFD